MLTPACLSGSDKSSSDYLRIRVAMHPWKIDMYCLAGIIVSLVLKSSSGQENNVTYVPILFKLLRESLNIENVHNCRQNEPRTLTKR